MKPILFNTQDVRAILDGRKMVTRRVIKPQPELFGKALAYRGGLYASKGLAREAPFKIGDGLWVRETWLKADDGYYYKADVKVPSISEDLRKEYGYKWRTSIHMTKEAARIFLKVTGVRVERLQDITEEQAKREGCIPTAVEIADRSDYIGFYAVEKFWELWDSTIKKQDIDAYGWAANPWVWVIEFERIDKEDCNE